MSEILQDLPQVQVLDKLAPQKYGTAAYANLSYTPAKLKDNLLYIEARTLKKDEEKNSQLREITTQNELLEDRLEQARREKQGIEQSLNQQITMYKKFINEMDSKSQQKIREMQADFSRQMQVIIEEDEAKARYAQAEKQKLEQELQRLQNINGNLEAKLSEALKKIQALDDHNRTLHHSQKQINFELEQTKERKKHEAMKKTAEVEELKKQIFQKQQNWKAKLHELQLQKQQQLDSLKRRSLQDLSLAQQKAANEHLIKNSQIHEITRTFNAEVSRLNAIIADKQQVIEILNKQISDQKQKILDMTKAYDREINTLIFQKNRLVSSTDELRHRNLELQDSEKVLTATPVLMNTQISNLKQLLYESYKQLEKCKEQLLVLDKQRTQLALLLKSHQIEPFGLRRSRNYLY